MCRCSMLGLLLCLRQLMHIGEERTMVFHQSAVPPSPHPPPPTSRRHLQQPHTSRTHTHLVRTHMHTSHTYREREISLSHTHTARTHTHTERPHTHSHTHTHTHTHLVLALSLHQSTSHPLCAMHLPCSPNTTLVIFPNFEKSFFTCFSPIRASICNTVITPATPTAAAVQRAS